MAQFFEGGMDTFSAIAHSAPHPSTLRFLEESVNRASSNLTDTGREFMSQARESYERFSGSHAMRLARAATRRIGSQWQRDEIRPLTTVDQMQQAPPKMTRWLMAEPTVRHYYHNRRCAGFDDNYFDAYPQLRGEDHPDYRKVMDGLMQETEDEVYFVNYVNDWDEDEHELLPEEQFDIFRSWQTLTDALELGKEDPTSRWNAEL